MITLVTGLWDIGRGNLSEGWSRSFDYYLQKFEQLLKIDCNLIIFGDSELKKFVDDRRSEHNTQFVLRSLDWFTNNEFYGQIQQIRSNPKWYNLAGWLKESTQAKLEMYNPLVMSKMYLLHDALLVDKFDSEKLYWIDAGLANTVNMGYFTHDNVLNKIDKLFEKFTFVCFPYQADREIHGFNIDRMTEITGVRVDKVARGGFFGGTKETIKQMNGLYYNLMKSTLQKGLMGTEESLFSILLYNNPTLIEYVEIESNGLLYKFFEDVKNDQVQIKSINKNRKEQIKSNGEVGLYVISFNSPKQFETLINSMLTYDGDFLFKTKKFLLNNSTDLSTTPEYEKLCKEYNFEHIKKDNIGITGGRVFVADHFNKSEMEYYIFFEDDMFFYVGEDQTCKNGFNRHTKKLFKKVLDIIRNEDLDFLKLNFTEFYGSHEKQWSWFNVDQEFRKNHWPFNQNLAHHGENPNVPNLEFKNIKSHEGVPYATGEVYLSNWPIILSREGNYKCYIETKFDSPFEQTLMSHCFKQTVNGRINSAVLLMTPTEHNRFDHYESHMRKEF